MLLITFPDGTKKYYAEGTTLAEIGREVEAGYDSPLAAGVFNGQEYSLSYRVAEDGEVAFIPMNSVEGMRAFVRSITFVCDVAMKDLFPETELEVCNSLGSALYCTMPKNPLDPGQLKQLEDKMRSIIAEKHPIVTFPVDRQEAIERAKQDPYLGQDVLAMINMAPESETLFAYELCGIREPFFEPLLTSTEHLSAFELIPFDKGFVINYPEVGDYTELPPWDTVRRINRAYEEAEEWSAMIGCNTISKLNQIIRAGRADKIIRVAEGLQEKKFVAMADYITQHRDKLKFILIAGPSSSGKTSSNQRLCVQLEVNGLHPIPISMDNYYVNREDTPKNPDGTYDFERVDVIDISLFNEHLKRLLQGETVMLPYYNFMTGHREYRGQTMCMKENSVFVIEGIHALNRKVTESVPDENKLKIFVSALTPMSLDAFNRIHTTDLRMLRRMVRDSKFRSHDALNTIKMWPSVRRGEEKYIFPCQEEADVFFNTSLIYEPAILRKFAVPLLQTVPREEKAAYFTARRLLRLLGLIEPLDEDMIPNNSILKEFIGGSAFAKEL
ncbi:nucleoside kinase [Succiniclasticum ruminis]|uniref:Uridine kinase n=1 Tax=Succiniclasticum ruminis DSM 9236 TaxID=1123323 RepID=A0A1I1ZXB1_9FIRM|nr:nucleoside kinase [Succiniclasticum ruminis]SFE36048.1 uridine kinase [Succiniclasticum ruminis DSM 9236]